MEIISVSRCLSYVRDRIIFHQYFVRLPFEFVSYELHSAIKNDRQFEAHPLCFHVHVFAQHFVRLPLELVSYEHHFTILLFIASALRTFLHTCLLLAVGSSC